ncbi:MAG: hypothetical protein WCJ37_12880 [Syntrophus sp. (in: bacteria)]
MLNSIGNSASCLQQMQSESIMPQRGGRKGGLFNDLDTDSNGGISKLEFEVLAQGISKITGNEINAEEVLSSYDVDGNKELSGAELFQAMSDNGVMPPPPPPPMSMGNPMGYGNYSSGKVGNDSSEASPSPPSFFQVQRGLAIYEMNSKDSTYQQLIRYIGSESQGTEKSSLDISA